MGEAAGISWGSGIIAFAMSLTQEQVNIVTNTLLAKGVASCPACHRSRTWSVVNDLVMLHVQPPQTFGSIIVGGPVLPCVAIVCSNCGNTQFHNVFALGLANVLGVQQPQQQPQQAEPQNG